MIAVVQSIASIFRSRTALQIEVLALRHQLAPVPVGVTWSTRKVLEEARCRMWGGTAMKRSVSRLLTVAFDVWTSNALTCAVLLVTSAHMAHAGTKVWTSQGPYNENGSALNVNALAIDPSTPSTLYAGTSQTCDPNGDNCTGGGVFQSTDGGASWNDTGLSGCDVNALAIAATTPITLYAGTDGGVYLSTNNGGSWSEVDTGLLIPSATSPLSTRWPSTRPRRARSTPAPIWAVYSRAPTAAATGARSTPVWT